MAGSVPHWAAGAAEAAEGSGGLEPVAKMLRAVRVPRTLQEAVQPLRGMFKEGEVDGWVTVAESMHKMPVWGRLTAEQSKAVFLYTLECDFYKKLNSILRGCHVTRTQLPMTLPYLRLLGDALGRAPRYRGTVYRGIGNLPDDSVFDYYKAKTGGRPAVWYQVNSCTKSMAPLDTFLKGKYCVFAVEGAVGADIEGYSAMGGAESEVLLFSCSRFKVDSCSAKCGMVKIVADHTAHDEFYDLHKVGGEGPVDERASATKTLKIFTMAASYLYITTSELREQFRRVYKALEASPDIPLHLDISGAQGALDLPLLPFNIKHLVLVDTDPSKTHITQIADGFLKTRDWKHNKYSVCNTCITSLNMAPIDLSNVTQVGDSFLCDYRGLKQVDLSALSQVVSIGKLFLSGCRSLETIDLSHLEKLGSVGDYFLYDCRSLRAVDLSALQDVRCVKDSFLRGCQSLVVVDLTPLTAVTHVGESFLYDCGLVSQLDLSLLSRCAMVGNSFLSGCRSLKNLDLTPLRKVSHVGSYFLYGCGSLTTLDVSPLSAVRSIGGSFLRGCTSLQTLDLTPLSHVRSISKDHFLYDCKLEDKVDFTPVSGALS